MPHAPSTPSASLIERNVPIPTWFGVGGAAHRFARPRTIADLRTCLAVDPHLRVLGDGANLLVDDTGVDELVVHLGQGDFVRIERLDERRLRVGAGVNLFKLINSTVGEGLGGLEVLAGVPASVGGALAMNAGGAFGEIASVVERVHLLTRAGDEVSLERAQIPFGYRHSGLSEHAGGSIITGADLCLTPADPAQLAQRKKEINDYKLRTQPMRDSSAGCCFKNPTLALDVAGIGQAGQRVSAGMLIDRAGLKGLRHGTALVSEVHANFLVVPDKKTGKARDVIELMERVEREVFERFGVRLQREVVVWSAARAGDRSGATP